MKISIVINGWITRMSGGDYHILQVTKYWMRNNKIFYFLPLLGYKFSKDYLVGKAFIFNMQFEEETENLFIIVYRYVLRIVGIILHSPKEDFDVVVATTHFLYDTIPAIVIKKRTKAKLVVYIYHLISSAKRKLNLRNIISILNEKLSILLIKNFGDIFFVDNLMTKKDLIRKGFREDKIFLTSNGLDHKFIDSIKSDIKEYDACFCGRLVAQKGIFDLIEIWRHVLKTMPNAKLLIVGEGKEYDGLGMIIEKYGLKDNIELSGYLSEYEKIRMLKSSNVFIFPSYEEGWGIAIAEAMSCGLPVIAYHLPVYDEVFEDNIVVSPINDIEKISENVTNLLKDNNFRCTLGEKCRTFIKKYDWKTVAKNELSFIVSA